MLTREKRLSLIEYQNELKGKLASEVPEKHINHNKQYKEFLSNELRIVIETLEESKLEGVK